MRPDPTEPLLGAFLVIDPQPEALGAIRPLLEQLRPTLYLPTLDALYRQLRLPPATIAVLASLDVVRDDFGAFITAIEAKWLSTEVLLYANRPFTREWLNVCLDFGVQPVLTPLDGDTVFRFACRAMISTNVDVYAVQSELDRMRQRHQLDFREMEIVLYAISGRPRDALAKTLGVSTVTAKRRLSALLEKIGVESLAELGLQVYTRVFEKVGARRSRRRSTSSKSGSPLHRGNDGSRDVPALRAPT